MEDINKSCKMHQRFCSEIVKRAPSILESAQWTDCTFVVGAEPHQVVVGGYKLIMALASPVFEAMFYGRLAETREDIPIVDVEPEIFQTMLQYMYTDKIDLSSWSEACQLYYAAKKYMLTQLMEICSEYLQKNLNTGNVCQIYEHSLLFEDDALTHVCNEMFSNNTEDLLKDNSFIAADINTVTTIFSLNALNLNSELDLIEAAARYAKAQGIKSIDETSFRLVSSTSIDEVGKQLTCELSSMKLDTVEEQQIRSAVKNIRFLTLTPEQYAGCATRHSLLTPSEDYVVLLNIAYEKCDVPMPSGFSTSRDDRVSKTSFYSRIDGFNGKNTITSQPYFFRNLQWQMKLAAYGVYRQNDSHCFSFLCTKESQSSSWSCDASVELRIISQIRGLKPSICKIQHVFSQQESECTIPLSSKSYYLNNGSLEAEVTIKINKLIGI